MSNRLVLVGVLVFAFVLGLGIWISRKSHSPELVNGIRPDVRISIAEQFSASANLRAAAEQLAAAFQLAIDKPDQALEVNRAYEKAKSCLRAIDELDPYETVREVSRFVEASVVNSRDRAAAYLRYNTNLSGQIFDPINPSLKNCNFDVQSLEN